MKDISKEECKKEIEMFENGKTPGNDGIPIEFYKTLWDILSDQLVDVFNFSFQLEEMTTSQRQAIITLIDKKGKDRSYLENWRPISLVNVDAKIASKVIANRIKCCLPDIIHHNQTGFIKDMNEGVVSKETVVLRRWGSSIQKFGFINGVDNVNWPPYRDSKS